MKIFSFIEEDRRYFTCLCLLHAKSLLISCICNYPSSTYCRFQHSHNAHLFSYIYTAPLAPPSPVWGSLSLLSPAQTAARREFSTRLLGETLSKSAYLVSKSFATCRRHGAAFVTCTSQYSSPSRSPLPIARQVHCTVIIMLTKFRQSTAALTWPFRLLSHSALSIKLGHGRSWSSSSSYSSTVAKCCICNECVCLSLYTLENPQP